MIHHGDCLDVLKALPDNSVDSLVTDPPYGLSKEPVIAEVMQHWLSGDTYTHKANGFMGKSWDSFVPGPEYWREVYRVMKPGAHGLVFAGTRTWDLMSIALRFAGFEFRDCIQWLHGQGFPKSLDVSKAIDKSAGAEREIVGKKEYAGGHVQNSTGHMVGGKFNASHGVKSDADQRAITAPATEDAKRWAGFGTALKPAWEPVLLIRKPCSEKTVAKNVLKWGTGALNIDASRIANEGKSTLRPVGKSAYQRSTGAVTLGVPGRQDLESDVSGGHTQGRFPANLVLSCDCPGTEHGQLCAVHMLDKQSGFSKTPKSVSRNARKDTGKYGDFGAVTTACAGDSWGASRFFYVAKVSSSERNAGLEGMPAKLRADSNKMMGESGAMKTGSGNDRTTHFQNHHPTVKPQKLMRYLIRMVTPPGGVVLDPFAGSGSTLVAAKSLGFEFVGIEREQEYHAIASKRVDHAKERP